MVLMATTTQCLAMQAMTLSQVAKAQTHCLAVLATMFSSAATARTRSGVGLAKIILIILTAMLL